VSRPIVSSIVIYKLHQGDADQINRRRADFTAFNRVNSAVPRDPDRWSGRSGHIGHFGNDVAEGDEYPAIVVRRFNPHTPTVNLQVLLDGNDTYWATSCIEGNEPGQWSWPPLPDGIELAAASIGTALSVGSTVHYVSHGSPFLPDGSQAFPSVWRAAIVTELTEVEVNEQNPAGDGIFRQTVGLMVANPTGQFFQRGVVYVPGKFTGPAREAVPGDALPLITCADLEFAGGTWHWPDH
jgi:hypothetical protein